MTKKHTWLLISGLLVMFMSLGLVEYQHVTGTAQPVWARDFLSGVCLGGAIALGLGTLRMDYRKRRIFGLLTLALALTGLALRWPM